MPKKHNYKDVYDFVKSLDCELISKEYINAKTNLIIKCSCGHLREIIYDKILEKFQKNRKILCLDCTENFFPLSIPDRINYLDVKEYIEKHKCKLITTEYKNTKSPLKIKCKCGHYRDTNFDMFKRIDQSLCNTCTKYVSESSRMNKRSSRMNKKHFIKTKEVLEFKYKQSLKYRDDFLPENYNQQLKCWDCGLTKNRRLFPYRKQYKDNKEKRCKCCNNINHQKRRQNQTKEQFLTTLLTMCKSRSKAALKRGRKEFTNFDINQDIISKIIEHQNGKCSYTGKNLIYNSNDNFTISIDRINSKLGYVKHNIQLVGKIINIAKNDMSHEIFLNLIHSIKFCKPINENNNYVLKKLALSINNTPDIKKIKQLIKSCKSSAKYRSNRKSRQDESYIFNITLQDVLDVNEQQQGKCIYSGYNLWNMGELPSIDRIDCSKGYLKDNIQLTIFKVNQAKSDLTHNEFMDMVNCIYDFSLYKPSI
tara:strand:+ start:301 stop:1737 length:1437 start_codon:yes stop_codon:yes gene_type:complete